MYETFQWKQQLEQDDKELLVRIIEFFNPIHAKRYYNERLISGLTIKQIKSGHHSNPHVWLLSKHDLKFINQSEMRREESKEEELWHCEHMH